MTSSEIAVAVTECPDGRQLCPRRGDPDRYGHCGTFADFSVHVAGTDMLTCTPHLPSTVRAASDLAQATPPEALVLDLPVEGLVLKCPHVECHEQDAIAEEDQAQRYSKLVADRGLDNDRTYVNVLEETPEFQTVRFLCLVCRRSVTIPPDLEVTWG